MPAICLCRPGCLHTPWPKCALCAVSEALRVRAACAWGHPASWCLAVTRWCKLSPAYLLIIVIHVYRGNASFFLWKTLRMFSINKNKMGSYVELKPASLLLREAVLSALCLRCQIQWGACCRSETDTGSVQPWTSAPEGSNVPWLQCHQLRPSMYKTRQLFSGYPYKHVYACIKGNEAQING